MVAMETIFELMPMVNGMITYLLYQNVHKLLG